MRKGKMRSNKYFTKNINYRRCRILCSKFEENHYWMVKSVKKDFDKFSIVKVYYNTKTVFEIPTRVQPVHENFK